MKLRTTLVAAAAFGLTAAFTAGHAQSVEGIAVSEGLQGAAQDDDLPRFAPSPESDEARIDAPLAGAVTTAGDAVADSAEEVIRQLKGGIASWYGPRFAGRRTASGERFDPDELTAAHRTLPFGSLVEVTHEGKSVVVRINDRGPFTKGRVIDLSEAAAEEIGIVGPGHGQVRLALLAE